MNRKSVVLAAAALGSGYFGWRRYRQRARLDLSGKVVLITGGSRGLGLQLAREFGSRGAVVAICARNEAELVRARLDLTALGVMAHAFVCDVSIESQVRAMTDEVAELLGPVDVLVNNAGAIKVGAAEDMTVGDFEQAMDVMFWGTLYSTLSVLPSMRERGEGSVVNITSIGGKVSVPHLLPYSCAKFATAALSEGLRTELAPEGIHVTTIVPGLMRTGSHLNAEFKGRQSGEYAWFAAGAATSVLSIGAERAARSIVDATVRREGEKILSVPADMATRFHDLFPEVTGAVLSLVNRLLPSPAGAPTRTRIGAEMEKESGSLWKFITRPGRRAAGLLNEV